MLVKGAEVKNLITEEESGRVKDYDQNRVVRRKQ